MYSDDAKIVSIADGSPVFLTVKIKYPVFPFIFLTAGRVTLTSRF